MPRHGCHRSRAGGGLSAPVAGGQRQLLLLRRADHYHSASDNHYHSASDNHYDSSSDHNDSASGDHYDSSSDHYDSASDDGSVGGCCV